jgi:hypothetical protein
MMNETQYRVYPTLALITAEHIFCTLNDLCHRNTSPNPQEGCTENSAAIVCIGLASSSRLRL